MMNVKDSFGVKKSVKRLVLESHLYFKLLFPFFFCAFWFCDVGSFQD